MGAVFSIHHSRRSDHLVFLECGRRVVDECSVVPDITICKLCYNAPSRISNHKGNSFPLQLLGVKKRNNRGELHQVWGGIRYLSRKVLYPYEGAYDETDRGRAPKN